VFTPEQRRAVDDVLGGYLANYEALWRSGQIEYYYLFPGSKMRMLDSNGRRWTGKVRAGVKPLSRDGARVAFRGLEAIARVEHVEGPEMGPVTRSPGPVRIPATGSAWNSKTVPDSFAAPRPRTGTPSRWWRARTARRGGRSRCPGNDRRSLCSRTHPVRALRTFAQVPQALQRDLGREISEEDPALDDTWNGRQRHAHGGNADRRLRVGLVTHQSVVRIAFVQIVQDGGQLQQPQVPLGQQEMQAVVDIEHGRHGHVLVNPIARRRRVASRRR